MATGPRFGLGAWVWTGYWVGSVGAAAGGYIATHPPDHPPARLE